MANRSRGLSLITVLLALWPRASPGQSLPFATYSSDDGLAESVVLAVEQGPRDGLPSSEVNPAAALRDSNGRLWFGTVGGATVFDPAAAPVVLPPPPVHILRLTAAERTYPIAGRPPAFRLGHRQNDLQIEFVGISFAYPQDVTYQYRLEGLDRGWRSTRSRSVDFPALPPGRYGFLVRASHGDGEWSPKAARLEIEITPPFWRTWWFRTILAAVAGLAVVAGHRLRVRSMRRQKKELEALVRERTAELRDLNAKKDEFLGIAAHDLRSPLGGVMSHTDLLLRLLDEDRMDKTLWRKFLGNVRTTAVGMRTLVDDLLDVAAIETGRVRLDLARQKMADILEEREALQTQAAEDKQIELQVEKRQARVEVMADRLRIGEVLDNLMTNAVKYTLPGGRVKVWCEQVNSELVTHVEDTGQGLAPDELAKVFTGEKLSPRPTAGESSTGLGLVIAKKLVELHGGRIWAASEKDKGSVFSFSLPCEMLQSEVETLH